MLVLVILLVLAATWVALRAWDAAGTAAEAEDGPAGDHADGADDDGSMLETVVELLIGILT